MITITWDNTKQKASGMRSLSRRVGEVQVRAWARDVGKAGQTEVEAAVQDGGVNKTAKGGARIRSGDMFLSAGNEVAGGGGQSLATAGFIHGEPYYTEFQERGTRGKRVTTASPRPKPNKKTGKGIPAMLAIPRMEIAMHNEMSDSGMRMLTKIAGEWEAI